MDSNDNPNFPPPPPRPTPPPPVLVAPVAVASQKKGRGWMVFAFILLALLGISMLFNIGHFFRSIMTVGGTQSNRGAGPRLDEFVVEEHGGMNKIAVVTIDGIISGRQLDQTGFNMVDVIKAQLKRAEEDNRVEAVLLKVDSPGGEVLASDDIAKAISAFQTKTKKPVIVSMGSLAASGGYYVSAPCRWIVANELTITGSIGVIMSTWNYRGLMDKVGVQPFTFKSGKFKDMLSGSREPETISPEEKEMVQKLINETYDKFKSVVADGRKAAFKANQDDKRDGKELASNWRDYADGRILSGKEAQELGFVDALGDFDKAVKDAAEIAGVTKYDLVEYRMRYDLADLFRMFGKTDAKGVKVDLGLDVPKLQAGHMYFLSPSYLQ